MPTGTAGVIVMLLSFALTFIVARTVAKWFWRRRAQQSEEKARAAESRQVRRARERKGRA
jgi:uncharacterized protein (DUF2062 family)